MRALLSTQCLQEDFVRRLEAFDPLPNDPHIGHAEALRLLGEGPHSGPVASVIAEAREQGEIELIHIRDWHRAEDPEQRAHLQRVGAHCLVDSPGARFVFESIPSERVIDASGLNDFVDADLAAQRAPFADEACRVGLMGVWTDAKMSFLAYELVTGEAASLRTVPNIRRVPSSACVAMT